MDSEVVIENARGEIDERLLTGTEGGILSRAVLADDPLIDYLHDEEVLQYLLAGAAAPTIVRGGGADPIQTEGSYRTLLAVTDARLLVVAGSGDGDRAVSLPYEEVAAIEHSAGVLTHTVLVRETPDRGLEIDVASGSDPDEAVVYARQRVEAMGPDERATVTDEQPTGPDEWAVPGRDESAVPGRDESAVPGRDESAQASPKTASEGTNEVQFDRRPGSPGGSNDGNAEADSGWGLAGWAHEVATDRPNGGPDGQNESASEKSTQEPNTGHEAEPRASAPTGASTNDGSASGTSGVDRIGAPPSAEPSEATPDSASFPSGGHSASSRKTTDSEHGTTETDTAGGAGDPTTQSDSGAQPNFPNQGAQPSSGGRPEPGAQPDLGAWMDTDTASGSGAQPASRSRSASESPDPEPGLVESLFEALVADEDPGIGGGVGGELRRLVQELAEYARQADTHLDAGATDDARAAAATADAFGAEIERIAADRDRPELRDRIARLRAEVRRAVVATEFGIGPEELAPDSGPSGADPGAILRRLMQGVDPYDFEHLVADLWEALGYQTAVTQSSQDLGVDVVARQVTPVEQTVVIQAKRYGPNTKVGREEIQQYASLHRQERDADLVVVVTTGECTGPAEEAAEDLNVKLVNGDRLAELIEEYELYDVVVEHAGGE